MFVLATVTEKSSSAIHGRNLDLKKIEPQMLCQQDCFDYFACHVVPWYFWVTELGSTAQDMKNLHMCWLNKASLWFHMTMVSLFSYLEWVWAGVQAANKWLGKVLGIQYLQCILFLFNILLGLDISTQEEFTENTIPTQAESDYSGANYY